MYKFLFILLLTNQLWAQTPDSSNKSATVDVSVIDKKGKPLKGEAIIFRGEKTGKIFNGITDQQGKIKQTLPPGDQYHVSVKSVTDTTKYTILNVPALAEDEFFTEPFWVKIQMEPARIFRLDHIHFDTDKASLRPDSYPQLTELLAYLQYHDQLRIEIAGHTDNTGTATHNLQLSQNRANTIRQYLISKGIPATRMQAKGYGDSMPVAENDTEEGRQLNRRTEVRVL